MDIIKKDGRLESFDTEKLSTSIENAAKDGSIQLTRSDLNIVVKDIENIIRKIRIKYNSSTSSYEVRGVVMEVLLANGFNDVLDKYLE